MKIKLYHGSPIVVEKPLYGYGRSYNDYGLGFYCTEHIELAKEWACSNNCDGYVNEYELELSGLKILNLNYGKYNILNWLAILVENRFFNFTTALQNSAKDYLLNNFLPNYNDYDLIIGYRADDSYFLFARSFLSNQISLKQLGQAMKLGKLGEQYCIKSKKAFSKIKFLNATLAESEKYYQLKIKRDSGAKRDYKSILKIEDIDGVFMRDIIKEEWKNDDPRLR